MMIVRSALAAILGLGILAAPLATEAQQTGEVPRIGILHVSPPTSTGLQALRQGLRDLGYIEGQNIILEYRWPREHSERLPALAAELVQLKVDVIVTGDPTTTAVVKRETRSTPIVMAVSTDPVAAGFVASLARPGGNITGFSILAPELSGKRLELLKEALPNLSRIALLWSPRAVHHPQLVQETEQAAQRLGVAVLRVPASGPEDVDKAFQAAAKGHAGAVLALGAAEFSRLGAQIAERGLKYRLPTMTAEDGFAEVGGLIQYGASPLELWRRAATYVDKILRGAKPADLPVEQPTKFGLVINLKTAKALGLTIPPAILLRADQIIE